MESKDVVDVLLYEPKKGFSTLQVELKNFKNQIGETNSSHDSPWRIHVSNGKLQLLENWGNKAYLASLDFLPENEKSYLLNLISETGDLEVVLSSQTVLPCNAEGKVVKYRDGTLKLEVVTDEEEIEAMTEDGAYAEFYEGSSVIQWTEFRDGLPHKHDLKGVHDLMYGNFYLSLSNKEGIASFPSTLMNYFKEHCLIIKE